MDVPLSDRVRASLESAALREKRARVIVEFLPARKPTCLGDEEFGNVFSQNMTAPPLVKARERDCKVYCEVDPFDAHVTVRLPLNAIEEVRHGWAARVKELAARDGEGLPPHMVLLLDEAFKSILEAEKHLPLVPRHQIHLDLMGWRAIGAGEETRTRTAIGDESNAASK